MNRNWSRMDRSELINGAISQWSIGKDTADGVYEDVRNKEEKDEFEFEEEDEGVTASKITANENNFAWVHPIKKRRNMVYNGRGRYYT